MQYFIFKTIFGILLGIILCIIFVKLAKRDPSATLPTPNTKRRIIRLSLFTTISICCFSFVIYLLANGNVKEYKFDFSYRQCHLLDDYYGKYDNDGKSDKYMRWYNYNKPRLDHMSYEQGQILYENHMYIERFGKDSFHSKNKSERDMEYRNAVLQERIEEILGGDDRYEEIIQMTLRGQLELLFSEYMTDREIMENLKGCEKVNNTRLLFDGITLLGFIFLSLGLYCYFFKPSNVSGGKKVLKIIGYTLLISAYFNCTDYHPEFVPLRAIVAYSLFVILLLLSYIFIRSSASNS